MSQFDLFGDAPAPPKRRLAHGVQPAFPSAAVARTAAALPRQLRLGTSSWSFPGWAGLVYADRYGESLLAKEGLAAYARHPLLRTVGVDRTFYAPIEAAEFARYAQAVPADFRFLVKAHAAVTTPVDQLRRSAAAPPADRFLDPHYTAERIVAPMLEGLGDKAGVLLFQFPPLGAPFARSALRFADHLTRFLEALPALPAGADGRGPRYAVEVRNREFIAPAYAAALARNGAVHCLNVHPRMPTVVEQSRQLEQGRAAAGLGATPRVPLTVLRWMLHPTQEYEAARDRYFPFNKLVDPDAANRAAVVDEVCAALARGDDMLVIANNKAEGSAPCTLARLGEDVAARLVPLPGAEP